MDGIPMRGGSVRENPRIKKGALLANQAYEAIKHELIYAEEPQGRELIGSHLAKRFGISRTPVHAALARLQEDGLVEPIPGKGTRVVPIDAGYIQEVFEVRFALECLAARKAAPFIDDQE